MLHLWSNHPDDGNTHAGLWHPVRTVLIQVGIGLAALVVYAIFWVALALLLHQIAAPLD